MKLLRLVYVGNIINILKQYHRRKPQLGLRHNKVYLFLASGQTEFIIHHRCFPGGQIPLFLLPSSSTSAAESNGTLRQYEVSPGVGLSRLIVEDVSE